ncbi:MAG: hypothetical protein M1817_000288 [Caeruleum heppii]|nr:MAG: hypothetical protein M1817_000288 [Caeruleum heppii]
MRSLAIPSSGVAVHGAPDADIGVPKPQSTPPQVMTLEIPDGLFDELLKAETAKGKGVQLSFGRNPILRYADKTVNLTPASEDFRHELYTSTTSGTDSQLSFVGLASHRLRVRDAEEITAGVDHALLALQSKLAAHEAEKDSRKTHFVADGSKLPPAVSKKRYAAKPSKLSRSGYGNRGDASGSPATSGSQPPSGVTSPAPTSQPLPEDEKTARSKAIRVPLIHLLAIGPITEKNLLKKLRCPKEDFATLLHKLGKQTSPGSEWQLDNRGFKELDAWSFPYPTQDDRQRAINNAVSAYDRLRLSREDRLWQLLLPKGERGKGKVLSKLQLHQGPIGRSAAVTPSIKVEGARDSPTTGPKIELPRDVSDSSDGSRKPTASDFDFDSDATAQSSSQSQAKKNKVSDREALSKRLLSKNPKKSTKPIKEARKQKPTGKANAERNVSIKSAEFVEDSDEEANFDEGGVKVSANTDSSSDSRKPAKLTQEQLQERHPPLKEGPKGVKRKARDSAPVRPSKLNKQFHSSEETSPKSTSSTQSKSAKTNSQASPASSKVVRTRKEPSQPKVNRSPSKPSPLGSSPPTNASDMDSDRSCVSSSSSSPLISQVRKGISTPTPLPGTKSTPSKPVTNGIKRKPTANHMDEPPKKRHEPSSSASPPVSESYGSSSSSPGSNYELLEKAKRFKEFYTNYEQLHQELSHMANPPEVRVQKLVKMHERLADMKRDIARAAAVGS